MSTPEHLLPPPPACPCVVLIGMAGAGKSTVGMALAQTLGWAFMDSDYLMEALYADRLQSVTDALSKEAFLDLEAVVLGSIRVQRTVIATGGSAVYRPQAMAHLATLGPVVFLDVPLETIEERIARNPDRGLAIAPGQTLADIFYEREALYNHYATLRCDARQKTPQQCARWIAEHLPPPARPAHGLILFAAFRGHPRMTGLRLSGRRLFWRPFSHDRDGALRPGLPPTSATG